MDDNGYVALSEKVTATFYDDEHEEWTQRTVTIADVLNSVCDDYTVLPSAQPEIIRCKDCKYKNVYVFPPKYDESDYCEKHEKVVCIADFCSWAERRTDG